MDTHHHTDICHLPHTTPPLYSGSIVTLDHSNRLISQLPVNASRHTPNKYIGKRSDTLTPWRNGLLPRQSQSDILTEHLGNLGHLDHRALAPAIQPLTASQRAVENKYTRKHPIALTPWRNGLLPGHSMGNTLNQHVEHLEHQALLPILTPNRSQLPLDETSKEHTPEKAPSPSPLGFVKPFPTPQTPAPCTITYATLHHDRTHHQARSAERPLLQRRRQETRGRAPTCYTTEPTNEPGVRERRATFSPAPKARDPRASPDLLHDVPTTSPGRSQMSPPRS